MQVLSTSSYELRDHLRHFKAEKLARMTLIGGGLVRTAPNLGRAINKSDELQDVRQETRKHEETRISQLD